MDEPGASELREYLRRANPPPNEKFDEFLSNVEILFKLRAEAEKLFRRRLHTAKARRGALPLDWGEIKVIVRPDEAAPPENVVTRFARESGGVCEELLGALRKVLVRERQKVSLGLVQQVDSHCLRWLTRQPGRDGVEKGGARQRILAVVRRENYNTLENRVFKDFLARVVQEASIYLRKYEKEFPEHDVIDKMRRLRGVCDDGLREPLLVGVGEIRELPVPNYVLRHDRRYSKIWKAYIELIRQASVAEHLWNRRIEVAATINELRLEAPGQTNPCVRYHAPIWFNPLDGRNAVLDKPFYRNEIASHPCREAFVAVESDVVVDLAGGSSEWDLLVYGRHDNAKPYLQNYSRPSIEDKGTGRAVFLSDILARRDSSQLKDYIEQLYARLGGKRWFVLVPDDWDALWQEAIIKAVPLARNQVFLVWRSVAAAIGARSSLQKAKDGDEVVVLDALQNGKLLMSRLTLTKSGAAGGLVPQRSAYKHGRPNVMYSTWGMRAVGGRRPEIEFLEGKHDKFIWPDAARGHESVSNAKHLIIVSEGNVSIPDAIIRICSVSKGFQLLKSGVSEFMLCLEQGKIPYYDELEALSLVVQTEDEDVVAKALVEANEKWPGGRVMETALLERAAVLLRGADHVRFLLCMGEVTPDAAIRIKRHDFRDVLEDDYPLGLAVRMTPGQGMAVVSVQAEFLQDPIELDFLHGMSERDANNRTITIATVEGEMLRSFPPDAPHVVADEGLWRQVSYSVEAWVTNPRNPPDGSWFAKATDLYSTGCQLPEGVKPIERLRRKNVFGNDPISRYPTGDNFSPLFRRLREAYDRVDATSDAGSAYGSIVRAIAWTYQSDNPWFEPIRRKTIERIEEYANGLTSTRPLPQEYSLCANLCDKPVEWKALWLAVRLRLHGVGGEGSVDEDLRLLYNLLQFHPSLLLETGLFQGGYCWEMMSLLANCYTHYNVFGVAAAKRVGYVLKCMLYLLRCRKFDGKVFLTRNRDGERYEVVRRCLRILPKADTKHGLHHVVSEYLEGRGTIAGLPTS